MQEVWGHHPQKVHAFREMQATEILTTMHVQMHARLAGLMPLLRPNCTFTP